MANNIKYVNQTITVNGNSERLSTNGYYTGQHKGTVMQDNSVSGTDQPYGVEVGIVRYGTVMQDSIADSTPTVGIAVVQKLTGCTSDVSDDNYAKNEGKTFTYTADEGYTLPNTVTVKIGGVTKTVTTDYTWTVGTGKLVFADDILSADTEITVTATA